jgi:hypothetical protein
MLPHELNGVPRVLHEPERDIDGDRLIPDQVDENRAAVLVAGIAETVLGSSGLDCEGEKPQRENEAE